MKRALATALLLTLALAGCSDDDGSAEPHGSEAESPKAVLSIPAMVEVAPNAPDLPLSAPRALAPSGATFDACTVVPPDLLLEDFGAIAGQALPQLSSLGDPEAADCFYFGSDAVIAIQATTRATQDLPEAAFTYEGIPGATEVPDADRGWALIYPGQEGADTTVSGLILVKGEHGLNFSISITGHPYDDEALLAFAGHVLEAM